MSERKKILVIGSNSFSGSDFIDYLMSQKSYDIVGVSRSKEKSSLFLPYLQNDVSHYRFQQCDLNQDLDELIDLVVSWKPQYIVNFAAQSEVGPSWNNPHHWFQTNVVALSQFLHAIKKEKCLERYVHISSPEVYGSCEGLVREDAPLNPSTPYAVSKAAADLLLMSYFKNYQFPVSFVRATNVYGAHQQLFKIIPRVFIYIKKGWKVPLHGGGVAAKSYIHIRDVSRGEYQVMLSGQMGAIYHLSPDRAISIQDLIHHICDLTHTSFSDLVEVVEERLGQDKVYQIDSSKMRSELGWAPQIELKEGLNGVMEWVNASWSDIQKESLDYQHKP